MAQPEEKKDEDIAVVLEQYKSVESECNPSHLDKTDINYPRSTETKEEILQNKSQLQSSTKTLPKDRLEQNSKTKNKFSQTKK
jgi:hypothetical protein